MASNLLNIDNDIASKILNDDDMVSNSGDNHKNSRKRKANVMTPHMKSGKTMALRPVAIPTPRSAPSS